MDRRGTYLADGMNVTNATSTYDARERSEMSEVLTVYKPKRIGRDRCGCYSDHDTIRIPFVEQRKNEMSELMNLQNLEDEDEESRPYWSAVGTSKSSRVRALNTSFTSSLPSSILTWSTET